jgi:signal transduction histidine kinase
MAPTMTSHPPFSWLPLPRRTARLRLTLFYGGLFLVSGVVLLAITNLLVRSTTGNFVFFQMSGKGLPLAKNSPAAKAIFTYRNHYPPPHLLAEASKAEALAFRTHQSDLHQLLVQSCIAVGVMTVLSVALGWLVAGHVLRPLRSITASAQRISASNLHERLALAGPDDEFKELGDTLDSLLSRLEASFEAQRRFVANASHELRTPLTLERTLLQLALADPGATRASLRSTCEELLLYGEAQERLIEALLTLATSEQGLETSHPVDLSAITGLVVDSARPEAAGLGVSLEHDIQPASSTGDPRLVERLVANLVHNALRHNMAGGSARVETGTRDGVAYLSVSNTGPVVDGADIERLFQPFQRLDGPRLSQSQGHGLGLAIVKAIATAHNATVVTKARPGGGLAIEVRFVAARPARVHVAGAAEANRELEPVNR